MEKPDWTYNAIPKDVYPERIQATIEELEEKLDEVQLEQLKTIINGVYLEGLLDGFRVMDYIQRNYFS